MLLPDGSAADRRARIQWEGEPTPEEIEEEELCLIRMRYGLMPDEAYEALVEDVEPLDSHERDNRELEER